MLTDKDSRGVRRVRLCVHPGSYLLDDIHVISIGRHTYVKVILPMTETDKQNEKGRV